jgi:hypothetical protein
LKQRALPLCLPHREAILLPPVAAYRRSTGEVVRGTAEAAKTYQRAAGRVCDGDFKMAIREADLNSFPTRPRRTLQFLLRLLIIFLPFLIRHRSRALQRDRCDDDDDKED